MNKAKSEQSRSINRLVNLIENIDGYKDKKPVKDFLKRDRIYIYSSEKKDFEIVEDYTPVRVEILKELIDIYSGTS